MRRLIFFLAALCAYSFGQAAQAGTIQRETMVSRVLGRDMRFLVYLPNGYSASKQRYPVLYLLHGAGGDENVWITQGQIETRADALIASGAIPPTVIVMPGCTACWWIDGGKDKAETAFWNELVPTVAKDFRTIESREGRLVAGLSAGGYGAVRFALKYPDRFAAAAALSPAVYSETPPQMSAARRQPAFLNAAGGFDQSMWTARNYPSLLGAYFAQPLRTPLFLVSGDSDRLGIAYETALLFKRMFEKQPELTELRIVDGGHGWAVWGNAMDEALRYIFRFAARPQTLVVANKVQGVPSHAP
jgi:enterochelin esterase-like enzyme